MNKKLRKTKIILTVIQYLACIALASLCILGLSNYFRNKDFKENFYQISSGKIQSNLRILQISDLHDVQFGSNNDKLISRVKALDPDIIVLTGDMINEDNGDDRTTLRLCESLVKMAPVYFIYGNHETEQAIGVKSFDLDVLDDFLKISEDERSSQLLRDKKDSLKDDLTSVGVTVLEDSFETIEVKGTTVDIYGVLVSNMGSFWEYAGDDFVKYAYENTENFKLMLCHEPYLFSYYENNWGDLVLCGHTHGGVVRIPHFGGLYDKYYGFLPERSDSNYVYGQYDLNGSPLIVSSGLSNKGFVRINNQPEINIIDVLRY